MVKEQSKNLNWKEMKKVNEACDKGEKGMPGPSSHTFFETNEGGWSEKYVELQRLCTPIQNFLKSNPEIAFEVVINKDFMISRLGTNSQMEEIDHILEKCIQRFRDAKRGTELRVLIAEYEELMFLRTKLLTQIVMAEQQAKHISEQYEPEIRFREELRAIMSSLEPAPKTGTNMDDKPIGETARTNKINETLQDIISKCYQG